MVAPTSVRKLTENDIPSSGAGLAARLPSTADDGGNLNSVSFAARENIQMFFKKQRPVPRAWNCTVHCFPLPICFTGSFLPAFSPTPSLRLHIYSQNLSKHAFTPHTRMASRDVLKVSALHYKDPSKTDEEFEKHVTEKINPAWVKLVKRHEVMKYCIVSISCIATMRPRFHA